MKKSMRSPNLKEEKRLWAQGYNMVAGLDEAGRGPLAGPVVAAAVVVTPREKLFSRKQLGIRDSKKLTEKQREFFYEKLTNHPDVAWRVGVVSEKTINRINIFQATKMAMGKALSQFPDSPNFLLIDGNFMIPSVVPQASIIAADEKVFSCTAAGIIAKVTRDRIMRKMHERYPQYGFDQHKGYGTALHIENLKQFGPCEIHRKYFQPISAFLGIADREIE